MELAWWQIGLGVIVGLIILTILVVLHELGHAIMARRNGVEVEEFGIGFPPRAIKLGTVKGTVVSLNWLAIGGFCKMKGESDSDTGKGTYGAASLLAKTKILLAGVGANFLVAVIIFTILAWCGLPKFIPDQFTTSFDKHGQSGVVKVESVKADSPAQKAGLKKGDQIVSLAGQTVDMPAGLSALTIQHAGKNVAVQLIRDQKPLSVEVSLLGKDQASPKLGVETSQQSPSTIRSTWSAPIIGLGTALQFFWLTVVGIVGLLANLVVGIVSVVVGTPAGVQGLAQLGDSVAGPVGILGQIFPTAMSEGIVMLMAITAIISVSLAVMNLLPIPGLDGGRWYLTLWYHCRHKKLTREREEQIVGRGMVFLFGLIIVITIFDIIRQFHL